MYLTCQNYHYLSHTKRWGVDWETLPQASNCAQVDDTPLKGRMSLKCAVQLLQFFLNVCKILLEYTRSQKGAMLSYATFYYLPTFNST